MSTAADATAETIETKTDRPRPDGVPADWVLSDLDGAWVPQAEDLSKIPATFLKLDGDGEGAYREFGRNVNQLRISPRTFSMVTDDLRLVLSCFEVKNNEQLIGELEREKAAIRSQGIGWKSPELRQLLMSALDAPAEQETPEQRAAALKSAIDQLVRDDKVFRRCRPAFPTPPKEAFTERVREIFRSRQMEVEALTAAVDEVLPAKAESGESIEDQIARIDKEIAHLEDGISRKFFPGFSNHFYRRGVVPSYWQKETDAVYTSDGSHAANIRLTRVIAEDFLRVWKSRAKNFNEPISINAISIATMPEPMAQTWAYAFRYCKIREELFDGSELKRTRFSPLHFSHLPRGW